MHLHALLISYSLCGAAQPRKVQSHRPRYRNKACTPWATMLPAQPGTFASPLMQQAGVSWRPSSPLAPPLLLISVPNGVILQWLCFHFVRHLSIFMGPGESELPCFAPLKGSLGFA